MARSTAGLIVIIAATLFTTVAFAAQRSYDRRLSAPPGGRLTFYTDVGSVTVVGHHAPEVIIHAELRGSESFLARFHISAEQTPSGVTIAAHGAQGGWHHWFDFGSNQVRFAVEVPRDYPVDLQTSGGDVDVRNLNASVRATTSGGNGSVQNVVGTVTVHTSGGNIEADHIKGAAELSTSGGNIHVTDSTGDLDLRTAGGDLRMQNDDGRVHAVTLGGNIQARLRANRGISFSTDGGDITLLLPQNTRASIEAKTSGGRITCDFPLSTMRISAGDHVLGALGGGGSPISLHASGGSIHIAPEQ